MEKKLQVKDLRISFRTSNGKVQAVRDISFDLAQGETLAIVGESGSGKSVTSKAILGIQAANSITESGEIIYDGQDLLKISEEEFHKIRGDKIAMIFQDPMSSLNPIMKIGKQLTEAMILKGKARQRESRSNFNGTLKNLNRYMIEAEAGGDKAKAAQITAACKRFDKFEFAHTHLEAAYNDAVESARDAIDKIDTLAFELEKSVVKEVPYRVKTIRHLAIGAIGEFVVKEEEKKLRDLAGSLSATYRAEQSYANTAAKTDKNPRAQFPGTVAALHEIGKILERALEKPQPNFFRMGYYLTFHNAALPNLPMEQLNDHMKKILDEEFMLEFIANAEQAIAYTAGNSYCNMEKAVQELEAAKAVFEVENLDKKACHATQKRLAQIVDATIDPLATTRDSLSWTFRGSLKSELERYFAGIGQNKKAKKVHDKEQRKYDAKVAKGKTPDWTVPQAAVTDLDQVRENILHLIDRLIQHYQELLATKDSRDYEAETVAMIDYLKANASGVVARVTRKSAKARAIKLMEEVGIANPHKRYDQYPFEFSGGMRQRIVIAIALAANPDILICDEPTTALDVTIQSQILELINKLKRERHLSVIFITHDLGVVANMADRVAVMYAGKIVEQGTANDIFYDPRHPYTWALLSSMPDLDTNEKLDAIPGTPPNMIYPPKGDAFAARNRYAMQIDFEEQPPMFRISDTHYAATWLLHPDAPKVDPPKIILDRIARMKSKREDSHAE